MEGLGYKNNQQPFLKLAQRAPWRVLVQKSQGLPGRERAAAVQGWLSAVSGLVAGQDSGAAVEGPPRGLGPAMSRREWHLSGLRPVNHPLRRMAVAAGWAVRYPPERVGGPITKGRGRGLQEQHPQSVDRLPSGGG